MTDTEIITSWADLPEVVLASIFCYLEILDKYSTSRTCKSWEIAAFRPEVWKTLRISGEKLFLQISCSMMCLDEMISDIKLCSDLLSFIRRGSPFIKSFKLSLCRWFDVDILETFVSNCHNLRSIEISIWPNTKDEIDVKVSEIIEMMLNKSIGLHKIRIYEVPVKYKTSRPSIPFEEVKYPPVPFGASQAQHLQELWIVNSFKSHSLSNIMYLVNIKELAINPQQLHYSLLENLASKSLRDLFIVANENTREFYNASINDTQWKAIRKNGPDLRVHCYFSCTHEWAEKETIFKPCMPLASIVYRKNVWLRYPKEISQFMTKYSDTLVEFVDYSLSELTYKRPEQQEKFSSRIDNCVIRIARQCQKLRWLTVKEPLSSATLLLIAYLNRNIIHFLVRDDMIIYKNDIPDNDFPNEIIKNTVDLHCKGPDNLNEKMSELLNATWRPLSRSNYFTILNNKYQKFK